MTKMVQRVSGDFTIRMILYKTFGKFKIGEWKKYYGNGKLETIGNFNAGNTTGTWKYYHLNGQSKSSGEYKNGYKIGEWKHLNTSGKKEHSSTHYRVTHDPKKSAYQNRPSKENANVN